MTCINLFKKYTNMQYQECILTTERKVDREKNLNNLTNSKSQDKHIAPTALRSETLYNKARVQAALRINTTHD